MSTESSEAVVDYLDDEKKREVSMRGHSSWQHRGHSPPGLSPRRRGGSLQELTSGGHRAEDSSLSYEPCSSAGNLSPTYSEGSTPSYLRWAIDLYHLLEDYEGVSLFRQYLYLESSDNTLEFWFACKALKRYSSTEHDKILSVGRAIYNKYIRSHGDRTLKTLSTTTRIEITKRITAKRELNRCTFDEALNEIERELMQRHAAFVTSDTYVQHVQAMQGIDTNGGVGSSESPKVGAASAVCEEQPQSPSSTSSSTSCENARACPSYLPTVHEEEEAVVDTDGVAVVPLGRSVPIAPVCGESGKDLPGVATSSELPDACRSSPTPPSSGTRSPAVTAGIRKRGSTRLTLTAPSSLSSSLIMHRRHMGRSGGMMPPHPYHTKYVPFLPTSAQDSELQSLSSDADTMSLTDSSIDAFPLRSTKKHMHKQQQFIRRSAEQNRDNELSQSVIPRTQRPLPREALMQTAEFAALLTEKLKKVQREQEEQERLRESLRKLSEVDRNSNPNSRRAAILQSCRSACATMPGLMADDDRILDDHVSRVWQDSPKLSPLRSPGPIYHRKPSPGTKSPDRRGLTKAMIASYPLAQGPQFLPPTNGGVPTVYRFGEVPPASAEPQSAAPLYRLKGGRNGVAPSAGPPPGVFQSHSGSSLAKPHKGGGFEQQGIHAGGGERRVPTNSSTSSKQKLRTSDTSGIESGVSSSATSVASGGKMASLEKVAQWRSQNADQFSHCEHVEQHGSSSLKQKRTVNTPSGGGVYRSSTSKAQMADTFAFGVGSKTRPFGAQKMPAYSEPSSSNQTMRKSGNRKSDSAADGGGEQAPDVYLSVGYYLPNEKVPLLTREFSPPNFGRKRFRGRDINLKQFKQLIPRKGTFRYFFKCASDEMDAGVVMREVSDDYEVLPLWEGKVWAKVDAVPPAE